MGEAGLDPWPGPGPGPGPGPRETQEPEKNETAAPGGARGGRAGPRGGIRVLKRNAKRPGGRSCLSRSRVGSCERTWLKGDVGRGCVYVYGRDSTAVASSDSRLVLCTVDTPASEICDGEGRTNLFLQLHGDLVRRLEPTEKPLQIVYDYLAGLGFDDPLRMQEEAANSDLSCMIRFYRGNFLSLRLEGDCSVLQTLRTHSATPEGVCVKESVLGNTSCSLACGRVSDHHGLYMQNACEKIFQSQGKGWPSAVSASLKEDDFFSSTGAVCALSAISGIHLLVGTPAGQVLLSTSFAAAKIY